jgi:hypothetical protein
VAGGGSLVDAGAFLGIGRDRDGNPGGVGTLTLTMGGTVKASVINCGAGGTINGDGGTLIGDVIADPACVIAPGFSPGTLNIVGTFSSLGVRIVLEVDAFGNHDVLAVEGTASFAPSTEVEVRMHPDYRPTGGAVLPLVQVQPTPIDPPQTLLKLNVAESGGGTATATGDLARLSQPPTVAPDVEIPATVRAVQIDIRPGKFPNRVRLNLRGALPVAIISTPAFDALTIDPLTIRLDGATVKRGTESEARPRCKEKDVNHDGRKDLLCRIVIAELPSQADGIAILDAMTRPTIASPPIPIRGVDFVTVVGALGEYAAEQDEDDDDN